MEPNFFNFCDEMDNFSLYIQNKTSVFEKVQLKLLKISSGSTMVPTCIALWPPQADQLLCYIYKSTRNFCFVAWKHF